MAKMIIDADQIGDLPPSDVIVLGAGAAGIPLAVELGAAGRRVLLVESGGIRPDPRSRALSRGEVLDPRHGSLERYRVRALGGTTSVWGGRCAPLDRFDFERRSWVPDSGWPISYDDLEPFYRQAHRYLGLGHFCYDTGADGGDQPADDTHAFHGGTIWRFSPPTDLGKDWRCHLQKSAAITVLLNTTCVGLVVDDDGRRAVGVELRTFGGGRLLPSASDVVVATGGLEAARLLLTSRSARHPSGIGNRNDLVGRFYTSHLTGNLGPFERRVGAPLPGTRYERDDSGVYFRRTVSLRPERQRSDGLVNFRAAVAPPPMADPQHRSAVLSTAYLAKRFILHRIPPEYDGDLARSHSRRIRHHHARNVLFGLPELCTFAPWWLVKRTLPTRKIPSMEPRADSAFFMHFDAEQVPNHESRVYLGDEADEFGVPRLVVDWRVADANIDSIATCCRLLARDLSARGVAELAPDPDTFAARIQTDIGVGSHHIGTTRMADSDHHGVVDRDCRVFGTENVYVASSSVFPTSGVANPTLTITAIALRIAAHLVRRGGGRHENGVAHA